MALFLFTHNLAAGGRYRGRMSFWQVVTLTVLWLLVFPDRTAVCVHVRPYRQGFLCVVSLTDQ